MLTQTHQLGAGRKPALPQEPRRVNSTGIPVRPKAGDVQEYPIHGPGVWTEWHRMNATGQNQARVIDRENAVPGSICLVAKSGRVLRVIGPSHA